MGSQPQKSKPQPQIYQTRAPQRIQYYSTINTQQYGQSRVIQQQSQFGQFQYSYTMPQQVQNPNVVQQSRPKKPGQTLQPIVLVNELFVDSVELVNNSTLQFKVYAKTGCTIQIYIQGQEDYDQMMQEFKRVVDEEQQDQIILDNEVMNEIYKSKLKLSEQILSKQKSRNGKRYWPLIIIIFNKQMKMIFYYEFEDGLFKISHQKYQNNQYGTYEIQEIYGINDTNLIGQMKQNQNDGDCIICLTNPIDTIIMPCRHMCLCHDDAKNIMEKKVELKQQQEERQRNNQQPILMPDFNLCPICRKEIETFIRLSKTG